MSSEYEKPRENERVQNKQTNKKKHITLDYISNFSFISYGELYQLLVLKNILSTSVLYIFNRYHKSTLLLEIIKFNES